MTGIHSALTASIPDLRSEVKRFLFFCQASMNQQWGRYFVPNNAFSTILWANTKSFQGQEREEEAGSEDIVTEVDNVLGKLMASLQKGNRLGQCLNSFPPDKTSSLSIREATLNLSA